jgi:hypothetical protein
LLIEKRAEVGSLCPAQESSSPPSRGSLTHNQTDCFRCQLRELNWEPYQSLQEVNASNNADSEVQPLAAQAKVPRPAKHDDAGARATMRFEALETVQNGTCSKTPKRVRKAVQPLQLLFSQSERERESTRGGRGVKVFIVRTTRRVAMALA